MKKSTIFLAPLFAAILAASGVARAEEVKIGTVDMERALQNVEAGRKAKSQLEKEAINKKKELEGEEASIKKMGEELKKQSMVLSDDARAKKQAELQERYLKFQEKGARTQMEFQQRQQELITPIVSKLKTIITDLSKKRGYTVILEKNENTVLFSQDKDDLTNEVISAFNNLKS
ncbi:MAG: OmpH family outer membrane protein [Bdellovibrionota bacterium]